MRSQIRGVKGECTPKQSPTEKSAALPSQVYWCGSRLTCALAGGGGAGRCPSTPRTQVVGQATGDGPGGGEEGGS